MCLHDMHGAAHESSLAADSLCLITASSTSLSYSEVRGPIVPYGTRTLRGESVQAYTGEWFFSGITIKHSGGSRKSRRLLMWDVSTALRLVTSCAK